MHGGLIRRCLRFLAAASSSSPSPSPSPSPSKGGWASQSTVIRSHALPLHCSRKTAASFGAPLASHPPLWRLFPAHLYSTSRGRPGRSSRLSLLSRGGEGRIKRNSHGKGAASSAKHKKKGKKVPGNPGKVSRPEKHRAIRSKEMKHHLGKQRDKYGTTTRGNSGSLKFAKSRSEKVNKRRLRSTKSNFVAKHQILKRSQHGKGFSLGIEEEKVHKRQLRSTKSNFVSKHQMLKRSQQGKGVSLGIEKERVSSAGARLREERKRHLGFQSDDTLPELGTISPKGSKFGKRVMRLDPRDTTSKRFQENDYTQSNDGKQWDNYGTTTRRNSGSLKFAKSRSENANERRLRSPKSNFASKPQIWKRSQHGKGLSLGIEEEKVHKRQPRSTKSNFVSKHQMLKQSQQGKGVSLGIRKERVSSAGVRLRKERKTRLGFQSDDTLPELTISPKGSRKVKRVMRLDPRDTTSKRFQENDCTQSNDALDKETDNKPTISKNAQFRAINPSPELLLHIERHLLGRRRSSEWHKAGYNVKLAAPLDDDPYSGKDTRIPSKDEVFQHKLRFAAAAVVSSSFPPADLPEIAFAGTSNVGKSSLINSLVRQWGVARTGDKPGLTQTINFFRLAGRLSLVDLPGYGFAYADDEKKEAWIELVKEYVTNRETLRRVCLVVDAKWGLKSKDKEFISFMESAGTRYQVVLTKTDLSFPIDLARRVTEIERLLEKNKYLILPLMMVSCRNGGGLKILRANLAKVARANV